MQVKVDWVRKVYADGRDWHVGNMVQWKEAYYLCFVNGTGHGIVDCSMRLTRGCADSIGEGRLAP